MRTVTASAWLLFATLLGLGECGHLYAGLGALLSALAAAAYLSTLRPSRPAPSRARLLVAGGFLLAAALSARLGETGVLAALALIVAAAAVAAGQASAQAAIARSHLLALAVFALLWPLYRLGGAFWNGLERLSLAYSGAVGRLVGDQYVLSATAIALPGLILAALFVLARAMLAAERSWAWALRALGILLAAHLIGLAALEPLAIGVQRWAPWLDYLLLNPQALLVLFMIAGLAVAERGAPPAAAAAPVAAGAAARAALAALAGALVWAFVVGWSPPVRPVAGRVLLYDRGFLDWKLPQFGRYGQRSGGMFGLLPVVLRGWGYQPTISTDSLIERHLADYQCVVLINVNTSFSARELEDLRRFVERGGSLLVLGDHTGVVGIRGPYNELLRPFGIRYQFDCASFPGNSWEYAMAPITHPLRAGLTHDDEPQIWVGASLEADPPARPVLLARYGFSDFGEPTQYEMSYLGDRKFNPGERLDDLVLAAERRYGRGRVLVFGDTSPFQSGALVKSQRFVARVFGYLLGRPAAWPRVLTALLAVVGLAVIAVALGRPRAAPATALAAVPLGVALGAALALAPHARAETPWPQAAVALIDHSHVERFDELSWFDDCVGGLEYNLLRNEYLPRWVERGLARELERASVLFVIAPARRFGAAEVAAVDRFVERGGWLFLSVGYEEREGSKNLLDHFGFDVGPTPLTQFEERVGPLEVRFHKGWPLVALAKDAQVLASHLERPVVAARRIGRGGVVVVGDSWFFLNRNLEGENGAYEGNVQFVRQLLDLAREGKPAS